jgi:hypothetical protein
MSWQTIRATQLAVHGNVVTVYGAPKAKHQIRIATIAQLLVDWGTSLILHLWLSL